MSAEPIPGRVVLIGASNVGKTSLIQRFLRGNATPEQKSTIGAVFHTYSTEYDGHKISMQIWDTAGQERYRALGPIYYRKSNAAVAVFDLTHDDTLPALKEWIETYREHSDDPFIVIAGNKCDLEGEIQFQLEETLAWAHQIGAECIWTSAFTGIGIEDLFNTVTKHLLQAHNEVDLQKKQTEVELMNTKTTPIESNCC